MKPTRIASRTSKLALIQAGIVKKSLEALSPGVEISIVKVATKGDRDKSEFLYKSDYVGFFTSEVEKALLDGRADLAVHSFKDLPTTATEGLVIAAIPKREYPADTLVASGRVASIEKLPSGATVGTSSLRRTAQLKHLRGDLNCVPLRGNVETRVHKVDSGQVNAAVIACAGLYRLGMAARISTVLNPEEFLIAPGQGALAVQCRTEDSQLIDFVSQLDDKPTRIATEAERKVLATMHGGCSIPLGAYARVVDDKLVIDAVIADLEGKKLIKRSSSSPVTRSQTCAERLAEELLQAGGKEILEQIRKSRNQSKG